MTTVEMIAAKKSSEIPRKTSAAAHANAMKMAPNMYLSTV
jgi:hypothetical protein